MYPPEHEIKDTTESNTSASYLDLLLSIGRDDQPHTSLYDERDDFNFHITNFPFPSSNIPSSLTTHPIRQGKHLLWMFYSEGGATFQYASRTGICKGTFGIVSKEVLWSVRGSFQTIWGPLLPNVTRHSGLWPSSVTPSIDQALHQFLTLQLILALLPNLTFYLIASGFHRTFAMGAACQQRMLTPPDTWSCLTLGLASVLMLRPISPELVLFPDFWVSDVPRYFCFCSIWPLVKILQWGSYFTPGIDCWLWIWFKLIHCAF